MTSDPRQRLQDTVDSVARTREHLARRLDHGDGWAEGCKAAEDAAAVARQEATDAYRLLRLSLVKHTGMTAALRDLLDLLRKPHPDQHPDYDLALRDYANRLQTILENR